jgi:hypothetical protein
MRARACTIGAATTALVAAAVLAGAAGASAPKQRFFETSGGAVSCELDNDPSTLGVQAFCQTVTPPRSVTLKASGKVKVCSGASCIGNPPDNVKALAAGSHVKLGPFRCTVKAAAVSCRIAGGAGFSISRAGAKKT